jgi:hypothetical protein
MKKAEKILGAIAIIAIVLKFLLISGSGFLTVISLGTLSVLYYLLSFAFFNDIRLRNIFKKESYRGISALRIIGTVLFGFAISLVVIAILFKLQSYPGGAFILLQGLISLGICLIVAVIRYGKTKSTNYKKIFSRSIIIGCFGLLLYVIPSMTLFEILHRNHPAYVQAVKDLDADPNNKELQDEVERQKELMNSEH